MEIQTHREMAQTEIQQERTKKPEEQMSEEQFLIDLYRFMKKRDTPIERIPNLGFKQIDLFVMFNIVKDFGGYHQVTVQQLWKQVYNTLGGNPRSTSAATCTRRHYEKLLLSYECHLTGVLVNALPRNQPKHFHYANFGKVHEDGQRPLKRKLPPMPLIPNPQNLQNLHPDLRDAVFPTSPHYAHYFHPGHPTFPPSIPMPSSVLSPHCPPAHEPWFLLPPSYLHPAVTAKEPLEKLRHLAERYKTGLSEPLNLSTKASRQESHGVPVSSFTPPSSSRSPKFLNKPSPLYTPHQVVRDDGGEAPDGEASSGDASYSHTAKASEAYAVELDAAPASRSPSYAAAPRRDGGGAATPPKAGSPRTDVRVRGEEEREGSPEVRELGRLLPGGHLLPGLSRHDDGQMEIEVPLSVFNNWLRQCGSSAAMLGAKQLGSLLPPLPPPPPPPREHGHRCEPDFLPTNLTFHASPRQQGVGFVEDLRLTRDRLASAPPPGRNHFTTFDYKPSPASDVLKNAVGADVYPLDVSKRKPLHFWDVYDKEAPASRLPGNIDSAPRRVQQDVAASAPYGEDAVRGGREGSEASLSAVMVMNSSSTSMLHLTTEEVMKLRKIISSSS
ncbi:AT-rich interactive domain-containing protein 5B [Liparis tanakae]|uniref:AT-rich interactive domain-containing protein 5B n=1 Tax=Liparis tanakae TaxID=230148 RepID=A0A4Z2GDB7_9TELE|nr:AT-rich interactive domain-containing protein 5B [Liparis tanakae]